MNEGHDKIRLFCQQIAPYLGSIRKKGVFDVVVGLILETISMNMWEQCLLGQPRDRTTGKWEFDLIEGYRKVKNPFKKKVFIYIIKRLNITHFHLFTVDYHC